MAEQRLQRRLAAILAADVVDLYNLGCALARMSEPVQAIDALESCYTRMAPEMVNWMKADSDLTSLHDLPRYKALVAKAERLADRPSLPAMAWP